MGPPIKYHDGIPQQLLDFFDRDFFIEVNGKTVPNRLPTIERFCVDLGIHKSTFYDWCKKYQNLSDAFDVAKHAQKDMLIQLSLAGFYKEGFAKFTAINITDMRERIEHSVDQKTIQINLDKEDSNL